MLTKSPKIQVRAQAIYLFDYVAKYSLKQPTCCRLLLLLLLITTTTSTTKYPSFYTIFSVIWQMPGYNAKMLYSTFRKVAVHHRVTSSYGSVGVPLSQSSPPSPPKKEDVLLVY